MNNEDTIDNTSMDYLFEEQQRKEMTCRYELPLDLAHFIILHAHNTERFGVEFRDLTYSDLVSGSLSKMQRVWVEEVVRDLKECLEKEASRLLNRSEEEERGNERAAKWRRQKVAKEAH